MPLPLIDPELCLRGKTAVVTGANTGIGLITARELARARLERARRVCSPWTSRCRGITIAGRWSWCVYAATVVGGLQKMGEAAGFASNGARHRHPADNGRLLSTLTPSPHA